MCVYNRTASALRVGVGEHNRMSSGRILTVSVLRQHESYNPSTIANDVSVLTLGSNVYNNHTEREVCTPSRGGSNADGYGGERLIVSGWGTMSEGGQ